MTFQCTSDFNNAIKSLLRRPKNNYGSCNEDIKATFSILTFEEICLMREMVQIVPPVKIIKSRIANSAQKLTKRDGYRIVYAVNTQTQNICFLYIFPKRGNLAQTNISSGELERLLETYVEELENNTLLDFNISE